MHNITSGVISQREYRKRKRLEAMIQRHPNICFKDRPLEKGEKSHWYCQACGEELAPDWIHRHKCEG